MPSPPQRSVPRNDQSPAPALTRPLRVSSQLRTVIRPEKGHGVLLKGLNFKKVSSVAL